MEILAHRVEAAGVQPEAVFAVRWFENQIEANGLDLEGSRFVFFLLIEPVRAAARPRKCDFVGCNVLLNMAGELIEYAGWLSLRSSIRRQRSRWTNRQKEHQQESDTSRQGWQSY